MIDGMPFIPAWIDDAGLSLAEFRLYCHLCRRADNDSGIAWPSYESMQEACGLSRATVARCLAALAARGLIEKAGKPFGGSCRYRIAPNSLTGSTNAPAAIISPAARMEASSLTSGTIEKPPIVSPENCNRSPSETPIVSPEAREGSPTKVPQLRFSNTSLAETLSAIWSLTPAMGRQRSSKRQLEQALRKAKDLPGVEVLTQALEAWALSDKWTKDGGQFVEAIHRWVDRRQWEELPRPASHTQPSHKGIQEEIPLPI